MKKNSTYIANFPFWDFSCEVYGPNQKMLLGLQERYGLNVNLVLFCCWYAASNQGLLSKLDIKHLLLTIHNWHERIVLPLRRMRASLKDVYRVNWAQPVREQVLVAELQAEQIEQLLLVDAVPYKNTRQRKPAVQRAAHACQNIATYSQLLYVYLNESDCLGLKDVFTAVFPELTSQDCLSLCRSILIDRQKNKSARRQLQLELLERTS